MTKLINEKGELIIDLYHGTSTLFLESILQHGLGGVNPIKEWKILELAEEVYSLCKIHLKDSTDFIIASPTFERMIKQDNSGTFNFQHGETYISPSRSSALRYSISNEYGSELVSYTIKFLRKLVDLKIEYAINDLQKKYRKGFLLIASRPSPLLIKIKDISASSLLSEHGASPFKHFEQISEALQIQSMFDVATQQLNFRLSEVVSIEKLSVELIHVSNNIPFDPKYTLHKIQM